GELQLRSSGQRVYYAALLRFAPRPDALKPLARGFEVRRELLDPETRRPVDRVAVGQTVRVRLTAVAPEQRYRVALVDPLPAGLEVIDARLAENAAWNHVEAHDDRVQVFADRLGQGTWAFEYLARATTAGSFAPARNTVEEMYRPAHCARTAIEKTEIAP